MTKSSKSTKIEKYHKNRKNSQKSIKIHKNRQKITKTKIVDYYLTRLTANICIHSNLIKHIKISIEISFDGLSNLDQRLIERNFFSFNFVKIEQN